MCNIMGSRLHSYTAFGPRGIPKKAYVTRYHLFLWDNYGKCLVCATLYCYAPALVFDENGVYSCSHITLRILLHMCNMYSLQAVAFTQSGDCRIYLDASCGQ
jgi:hypothetical protein